MFRVPLLLAALTTTPLLADVTPFDDLARRLFLLRVQDAVSPADPLRGDHALWTYDDADATFRRLAPFRYDPSRVRLGAVEDRVVAQGSERLEFDAASGRFLRRYESTPDARGWVFSGAAVGGSAAERMGLEPGIYGFIRCPPGFGSTGLGCWGPPPAGEPHANGDGLLRRLYRRSLDPRNSSLTLVGELPVDPTTSNIGDRFIAPDPDGSRFLLWSTKTLSNGGPALAHDLSSVQAHPQGGLSETLLLRETESDPRHSHRSIDFAFVPRSSTLFHLLYRQEPAWAYRFTKRPLTSLVQETIETIEHTAYVHGQTIVSHSMTALPGVLPVLYEQLIPIVGDARGANGTHWRSDLWMFNPSGEPATVELRSVRSPALRSRVNLPAYGSVVLRNVLRQIGGDDGLDAIVLTSPYRWGAQISAYSRAYTESAAPGEEGGTFGQAVPAVPTVIGYSNHVTTFAEPLEAPLSTPSHLILDRENPGQFRHNLGVVNDSDRPLTVRLRWNEEQSFVVAPHSVANVNLDSLFPPAVQRLLVAADQPAAMWLSMIDNRTGDATFVPFTLFGLRGMPDSWTAVPGVARTQGANGTWWWTDLYGEFRSVDQDEAWHSPRARLQVHGCRSDASPLQGGGHFFRDVVRLAGCDEPGRLGALELRTASWTVGFTRTYTTRADGGTYGEMLPFYPFGGWPVQHFAGVQIDEQFRVNVGLYNGMDRAVAYTLRLYREDGSLAHDAEATLAAHESRQAPLAQWLGANVVAGVYGLSVIPRDEPGSPGRSWAYVSLVDNITNDPTNWW